MNKPRRIRATELYCTGNLFRHKVQRNRTKYSRKPKHKGNDRCRGRPLPPVG